MRAKRSKQYRKLMHHYSLSFAFREPYQVLLDADVIKAASRFKMRLGSLLESTLHGQIKPMITQCCIRHLYNAPATTEAEKKEKDAWIEVAKAAERRRCDHQELEEPLSVEECLESVVDPKGSGTNRHRYVVASQDGEVRAKMRTIAGVPLVYINRSVMILEPMAGRTEEVREREERGKVRAGLRGRREAANAISGAKRKRDHDGEEDEEIEITADTVQDTRGGDVAQEAPKKRKVKGPKGPNPLSIKKARREKQKPVISQGDDAGRAVAVQKSIKPDSLVADKAVDAVDSDGQAEGPRKRKRKRKPHDDAGQEAVMAELEGGRAKNQ